MMLLFLLLFTMSRKREWEETRKSGSKYKSMWLFSWEDRGEKEPEGFRCSSLLGRGAGSSRLIINCAKLSIPSRSPVRFFLTSSLLSASLVSFNFVLVWCAQVALHGPLTHHISGVCLDALSLPLCDSICFDVVVFFPSYVLFYLASFVES